MKDTWNLYRCSPLLWAGLEYEDALHFRVDKALVAKNYYRLEARAVNDKNSNKYRLLVELYNDSQDAVEWNRKFIDEIKEAREKEKDEENNGNKGDRRKI